MYGSKNAALPLLACTLLTSEPVLLDNIPNIADVSSMIDILRGLGAEVEVDGNQVQVRAENISTEGISNGLVGSLRGSILLLGALIGRNGKVVLPKPGGDIIGARPIDVHLDAFRQLGADVVDDGDSVSIDAANMRAGEVVLNGFSVTATENILLAVAGLSGTTTIHIAAAEPHVVALADLLIKMGVKIEGAGTHTIIVHGTKKLSGCSFTNIPDMLEAGFFILLAAAAKSDVTVLDVPVDHLRLFFKKLDDIGVSYSISGSSVSVSEGTLKSFSVQTLPYPGIATDLQAPFSVIATQAVGSSLIHDPMYEGRFKYVGELIKMGADAVVRDPHRVVINGPTKLTGKRIPRLDIRAGATLVMAGLIAEGETIIDNAEIIDRGYADLAKRLSGLGANILQKEDYGLDS